MTLECDAKFEEKLTCGLENDMRNLANFHQSMFESLKIGTLMGSFYPKQKMYELKIHRGVLCHDMENDAIFEGELTCQFKIDGRNFTNFNPNTQNSHKYALIGCF